MFILANACETSAVLKVIYFIKELLKIACIIIPVGLMLMITLDLLKNVIGKEEDMSKNLKMILRRIIYCVVIFLVPFIVNTVVSLVNNNRYGEKINFLTCMDNANKADIKYFESLEKLQKDDPYVPDAPKDPVTGKTIVPADYDGPVDDGSSSHGGTSGAFDADVTSSGSSKVLDSARAFFKAIDKQNAAIKDRSRRWAHKSDKRKYPNAINYTTCCYSVSKILSAAGYLKDGTICHQGGSATKPSNWKNLKNMEIIVTSDMSKLKPGDVMLKNGGSQNIAIFSGKSNGDYYIYGASDTSEIRSKHPSKNKSSWWKKHGITAIIRAKK